MADRFENGDTGQRHAAASRGDRAGHRLRPDRARASTTAATSRACCSGSTTSAASAPTSIWLTPSFKNKAVQLEDGPSAGYHGYWITDFTQIDPHLGTQRRPARAGRRRPRARDEGLLRHHHQPHRRRHRLRGGRAPALRLEGRAALHGRRRARRSTTATTPAPTASRRSTRRRRFPYTPVLDPAEQNLKVPAWLNDVTLYHNRGDTTFVGENSLYGDFFGLDDLFTEHPRVVRGMIDIYKTWIRDFGVDGFRIDTMKHVDDEFWQRFGPEVLRYARAQGKREFFMFGEVFDTTKSFTSHFTTTRPDAGGARLPVPGRGPQLRRRARQPTDALRDVLRRTTTGTPTPTRTSTSCRRSSATTTWAGSAASSQADNPGAGDAEWLARDRLAHELMYFSRGNPVDLLRRRAGLHRHRRRPGRPADDVRQPGARLPRRRPARHRRDARAGQLRRRRTRCTGRSRGLAALTRAHPALRDGAQQHRLAERGGRASTRSRGSTASEQREYVVALNNSEPAQTAAIPTYVAERGLRAGLRRRRAARCAAAADGALTLTVPPLSAVVYALAGRIPRVAAARRRSRCAAPAPAAASRGRMQVRADVGGDSFYEVTFHAQVGDGALAPDRHRRQRAVPGLPRRHRAARRARPCSTARSCSTTRGHTRTQRAAARRGAGAGADDRGAGRGQQACAARSRCARSPTRSARRTSSRSSAASPAAPWTAIGTDDSSPAYTVVRRPRAAEPRRRARRSRYRAILDRAGRHER